MTPSPEQAKQAGKQPEQNSPYESKAQPRQPKDEEVDSPVDKAQASKAEPSDNYRRKP